MLLINRNIQKAAKELEFDEFREEAKVYSSSFCVQTLIWVFFSTLGATYVFQLPFRTSFVIVMSVTSVALVMCTIVGSMMLNFEHYYEGDFLHDPVIQRKITKMYMNTTGGSALVLWIGRMFGILVSFCLWMNVFSPELRHLLTAQYMVGIVFFVYVFAIVAHSIASASPRG